MNEITVKVSARWWVRPLGWLLYAFHRCTGWKPADNGDWLVQFLAKQGFKYTVVR